MNRFVREHVPLVAGILSVVSLALVFATAGGFVPGDLLPRVGFLLDAIPHLNALISLAAILVIAAGVRAIKRGDVRRHRRAMLSAFGLFAGFLALYLYRIAILGPKDFPGAAWLETYVYLPVLAIHILLAIVCVPLLYYVALLGVATPVAEIPDTRHPRLGRLTVLLWITSFALGILVYLLLYWLA
jgi:putative membrane protein